MNRRTFLQQTTAATAGWLAGPRQATATLPGGRIVDTHTHFYDPLRQAGVPWPNQASRLYRQVLPKDWLAVAAPHGITETVVVEASSWLEDNAWVLDLATKESSIVGFVGHLLPHHLDFARHLERFASNPIFRGVRVSDADFLGNVSKSEFRSGLHLMTDLDLELDLNGPTSLLLPAANLAAELPALRIVIDHLGNGGDPTRLSEEWRNGIKALASHQNVFCKISGFLEQTDAAEKDWGRAPRDTAYYAPLFDHCWECFGEDRLIYGSNWPVCEKGGSYADQFKIVAEYFAARGKDASEKYFWRNARNAYRWPEPAGR